MRPQFWRVAAALSTGVALTMEKPTRSPGGSLRRLTPTRAAPRNSAPAPSPAVAPKSAPGPAARSRSQPTRLPGCERRSPQTSRPADGPATARGAAKPSRPPSTRPVTRPEGRCLRRRPASLTASCDADDHHRCQPPWNVRLPDIDLGHQEVKANQARPKPRRGAS